MKTVVKMFQPRFAPLVKSAIKRQTVRKIPKRKRDMPEVGDRFLGREWMGAPYRTKQRILIHGTVTDVQPIELSALGISINGALALDEEAEEAFAIADGFDSYVEMEAWFAETHGLPFKGILIKWEPAEL